MTREAIEYLKFHRKIFCDDYLKICPKDSIAYQATLKEKEFHDLAIKALEQEPIIDKLRTEIKAKIEEEEYARSVFRHEEKDAVKAEQCTGSIMAYNNVIKLIDKYKAESEE